MEEYKLYPILVVDSELHDETGAGRAVRKIEEDLKDFGFECVESIQAQDALDIINTHKYISAVLVDWQIAKSVDGGESFIDRIRQVNLMLPLFVMTERHEVGEIDYATASKINGYFWKLQDTPSFIAGRIKEASKQYLKNLVPPFFAALQKYVEEDKYAWHTPGHMGGDAFLESPAGTVFYQFFGEQVFRADLSVSVPELGSLMEHSGVVGEAERFAAKIFGAEQTYFVTNGTSTANKIVMCACITPGDIVLVDRNCHKSLQHALTMTGAIPIYFVPTRNAYGIIGGIHLEQFEKSHIKKLIQDCSLIKDKSAMPKMAVITNSTYDGILYDVVAIKDKLSNVVDHLHFDEAWYAYARFHELYDKRYAMCDEHKEEHPALYATQSTHKLLAAFSQASMVHLKSGSVKVNPDYFNEAFMMHTSTSPQYNMIASLDVATKMMEQPGGKTLMRHALHEAVNFRKKMRQLRERIADSDMPKKEKWFFDVWQPSSVDTFFAKKQSADHAECEALISNPKNWHLQRKDKWHGFQDLQDDYLMLDPIKVTLVTPGTHLDGTMGEWGIPAPILSKFLMQHGIVDEKTGFYTFLLLFSIGVINAKVGTLLVSLLDFKKQFDENRLMSDIFPNLVAEHPDNYDHCSIQAFAQSMHLYLRKMNISKVTTEMFSFIPEVVMSPAEAYHELVRGNVEELPLEQLHDRVPAVMLVPYPPGIPIIMPGEKFSGKAKEIVEYLKVFEEFDNLFPGFETETHGISLKTENGKIKYYVPCIK